MLEVERYVAVVVRPDALLRPHALRAALPQRIARHHRRRTHRRPLPAWAAATLDSLDVPGLYLAGDVTGLPLIKNAILQGTHAAERIAASLGEGAARCARVASGAPPTARGPLDLVIVGAGPAGIRAALRAGRGLGLSFEVIEQGSVAQSIKSFPRGKLVFDQPLELPVTGKLWLRESTKEELLSHWLRIVRQAALPVREDTRMTAVAREVASGLFQVTTEPREGGAPRVTAARRVLLAIGQRGSPRRLPFALAPDVEARVHYHLSDAKSFEGQRVIVVGLGDVAMEAAVALSRQPSTAVTLVHRGDGFSRGKSRNIGEVKRLVEAGRIGLRLSTQITAARGRPGDGAGAEGGGGAGVRRGPGDDREHPPVGGAAGSGGEDDGGGGRRGRRRSDPSPITRPPAG